MTRHYGKIADERGGKKENLKKSEMGKLGICPWRTQIGQFFYRILQVQMCTFSIQLKTDDN